MMKKRNYLLLLLIFNLFISKTYALTIRETSDPNDGYTTMEEGSVVIGVTRFSSDTIVTASKAATAGANDAMLHILQNGTASDYDAPVVYYYVDPYVGWFSIDNSNKVVTVTDPDELEMLSKLDIYYVDNVEKVFEVELNDEDIDDSSLPDGVAYKDNKLFINATIEKIEFRTKDEKKISFLMDLTISKFIKDIRSCYTVNNGIIIDYDPECGNNIIIPTEINNEKIIGIGANAFKNVNLVSVVIPSDIKSLGNNAFANNKLESVIIKDKYDESDFSLYGDNVFGNFNDIVYDNDLYKILNNIDSEYKIKYYKEITVDRLINNPDFEYGLRFYIYSNLVNTFRENGYDYDYQQCWYNYCDYESFYRNGEESPSRYIYGIGVYYIDDYRYNLVLEKYDVFEKKIYSSSKPFKVIFEEDGNEKDEKIVLEAINNLQRDDRFDDEFNPSNKIPTRLKYIQDIEDLYDIKVVLTELGCGTGIEESDKILYHGRCMAAYYLKDGVIYRYNSNMFIFGLINEYYTSLDINNYDNIDLFIEGVLNEFEEYTGINNYYINLASDDKLYRKGEQKYNAGINYKLELINMEFSEKWIIEFLDYYPDQYDNDGYTKVECFGFDNGIIISYNGMCGANVKIPNQINGIDVIEIASDYDNGDGYKIFAHAGIKSIVLPNNLKKIGNNAFYYNYISELIIPDTVSEIGSDAFYNNKIDELILPESLVSLGYGAFEYNNIENLIINDNLEEIGSSAFAYNKIRILLIPGNIKIINSNAFNENELESVIINEGVEIIGNESFANNKISNLTLPESLKSIGNAAFNNNQLADEHAFIYGRKYDEENNRYIDDYEHLVSYAGSNRDLVIIPNSVKIIDDNALKYCGIREIKLPYGLEKIGNSAFENNKLTSLCIPNTVSEIGEYVFYDNKFSGDNSFIYLCDEYGNIDKTNLVAYSNNKYYEVDEIIIPSTVKKIWANAFAGGEVNNLVIPYGVLEIGDYAFQYLNIKNEISLPKSIEKIGKRVFYNLVSYNDVGGLIYARNEDGTIDKSILMAYNGYINYDSDRILKLPEGIVEIRENVFSYNYDLDGIVLPSTLEKIGDNAFYGDNITEYTIPSSVKSIGNNAFSKDLKIIVLNKNSSNDFEYLGENAFGDVKELIYENSINLAD